jgi:3-methyladenine DNA glycosylase AlkC
MAEPLKNIYNPAFIAVVANYCKAIIAGFDKQRFTERLSGPDWERLELKQRIASIADALNEQLTGDYLRDVKTLTTLSNHIQADIQLTDRFEYLFLPTYLEKYGIEHPDATLDAIESMTILSSCEFAVRPFIVHYQPIVMAKMVAFSQHSHPSVRRFSSEGCRPRLPWGIALQALKKDPTPILPILETLKSDPSLFVRKSVANNLNDIAKDHPAIVKDIVNRWKGTHADTDWIVKHGSRTLLKKGDSDALGIFGLGAIPSMEVSHLNIAQKNIKIGGELQFTFDLKHNEPAPVLLRLEYKIYYQKANGSKTAKVFKISETTCAPALAVTYQRKQSFRDLTTRKHHVGEHELAIVVNGQELARASFMLEL